jgi:hypothetical protein
MKIMTIDEKNELRGICENEFGEFTIAITKMGFDPQGFVYALLAGLPILESAKSFPNLTDRDIEVITNRINLFS